MRPVDSSNGTGIQAWSTTDDEAKLLEKQPALIPFADNSSSANVIEVNGSEKFQTIDGFGYSLTGGSAHVINRLPHNVRSSLLKELFGDGDGDIHVSYLRVSIGASDLDSTVFSYDDLPAGDRTIFPVVALFPSGV
ncbi:hypothetical protein BH20BAC1_BH20BAC1_12120 [soil metagenome]